MIQVYATNTVTCSDITGWLLKAYKSHSKPAEDPLLGADSRLIIVAGSDTTSATLTFLFYHLAKQPEEVKKLRDELRPMAQGDWTDINIRDCQHLNGAIHESLRLHPPVPSGLERKVPAGGATINGTYLPADTIIWMPQYVISRGKPYSFLTCSRTPADRRRAQTRTTTKTPPPSSRSAGTPSPR